MQQQQPPATYNEDGGGNHAATQDQQAADRTENKEEGTEHEAKEEDKEEVDDEDISKKKRGLFSTTKSLPRLSESQPLTQSHRRTASDELVLEMQEMKQHIDSHDMKQQNVRFPAHTLSVPGVLSSSSGSPSVSPTSSSPNSLATHLRTLMLDSADTETENQMEMLDYDAEQDDEQVVNRQRNRWSQRSRQTHTSFDHTHKHTDISEEREYLRGVVLTLLRVLIAIIIGINIGLIGFVISYCVRSLIRTNLEMLRGMMNSDAPIRAFFVTMTFSLCFTFIAACTVTFGSWYVKGSGVGKLQAFLAGVGNARSLTFRTLWCKTIGLVCSVSAGLKLGMEGPIIHLGAMIGLHTSHFLLYIIHHVAKRFSLHQAISLLQGVGEERIFITGGAAAGFSVAFNAPIAGILYVQDGAFAYWNGEYTFRSFICTMVAVTTINLCYSQQNGVLPSRGLIDLDDQPPTHIVIEEFYGFLLLGIIGGLLGAAFTKLNVWCEKKRALYLANRRLLAVLDALVCAIGTILMAFSLPFILGCTNRTDMCNLHPDRCLRFQCGPGSYSELATLFFALPEEAIRILFDRNMLDDNGGSVYVLLLFAIVYFLLAASTYGTAVPGGLFIPSIIIGASYGRVIGIASASFFPPSVMDNGESVPGVNAGVYAVLGSASMLGGMTRMTLPISVMMIEITSDAQFLIPIMLCVIVAKVIADQFIGSLYAEHLRMDGLVLLFGDRIPKALQSMLARDMMSRTGVVTVNVIDSTQKIGKKLSETTHNAFPVVETDVATIKHRQAGKGGSRMRNQRNVMRAYSENHLLTHRETHPTEIEPTAPVTTETTATHGDGPDPRRSLLLPSTNGVYLGLIQRRQLVYALHHFPIFPTLHAARDSQPETAVQPWEVEDNIEEVKTDTGGDQQQNIDTLAEEKKQTHRSRPRSSPSPTHSYLNVSSLVDEGAYMVGEYCTARRVWSLFRGLGMRHIVVVDRQHQPVGIITRRDLIMHAVAEGG